MTRPEPEIGPQGTLTNDGQNARDSVLGCRKRTSNRTARPFTNMSSGCWTTTNGSWVDGRVGASTRATDEAWQRSFPSAPVPRCAALRIPRTPPSAEETPQQPSSREERATRNTPTSLPSRPRGQRRIQTFAAVSAERLGEGGAYQGPNEVTHAPHPGGRLSGNPRVPGLRIAAETPGMGPSCSSTWGGTRYSRHKEQGGEYSRTCRRTPAVVASSFPRWAYPSPVTLSAGSDSCDRHLLPSVPARSLSTSWSYLCPSEDARIRRSSAPFSRPGPDRVRWHDVRPGPVVFGRGHLRSGGPIPHSMRGIRCAGGTSPRLCRVPLEGCRTRFPRFPGTQATGDVDWPVLPSNPRAQAQTLHRLDLLLRRR